jgi:hypothetical protein
MAPPRPPSKPQAASADPAAARKARLGEALRANLKRRKAQARERDAENTDGPKNSGGH